VAVDRHQRSEQFQWGFLYGPAFLLRNSHLECHRGGSCPDSVAYTHPNLDPFSHSQPHDNAHADSFTDSVTFTNANSFTKSHAQGSSE
jgi:hypothetical protein